jgi:hypothetical protein
MSQIQQIRANATWVAENLGKQSGIVPFANTTESISYLDGFLERQKAMVKVSEMSIKKFVSLLGAYLGECIIANYGGEWQDSPPGVILIRTKTQAHFLRPFDKVYKRIVNGGEDSLACYFSDFIRQVLASE